MGIAAGGLIKQCILEDRNPPDSWVRMSVFCFPSPRCLLSHETYLGICLHMSLFQILLSAPVWKY